MTDILDPMSPKGQQVLRNSAFEKPLTQGDAPPDMTADDVDELAARIARDLFTNGNGDRALRLEMVANDRVRRYLGGWSEVAVASRIAKMLREAGG